MITFHTEIVVRGGECNTVEHMENEQNGGLRSIERSNLSGAKSRGVTKRKVIRKKTESERPRRGRKHTSWKKYGIIVAVVFIIVFVLMSTMFASARLEVTLASAEVTIDGVFSAIREPAQSADISYGRLGPFEETRSAQITDITRERQNTYAEGVITVYNTNTSGEKLDLVNRTRFQATDGRIYRLSGKQIIPGGKTVGGEFVPGRKEVRVVADSIGDRFNLEKKGTRLSIPGLQKYKEFADSYAITETKVVGGFSGERLIPNKEKEKVERERLRKEIEKVLKQTLEQALETNTLAKKVVFDDGKFISFESLENEQNENGVTIKEKGILHAATFREAELAALLGKSGGALSNVPGGVKPNSANTSGLTMEIIGDEVDISKNTTEFDFRLKGNAKLFWSVDEVLLLGDIEGKKQEEAQKLILGQYPQVIRIDTFETSPFWRSSVPGSKAKIEFKVEYADK